MGGDPVLNLLQTVRQRRLVHIVGTDTGVGKTRVAALLCRMLVEDGAEVAAVKLLATGCTRAPAGGARNEDAALLFAVSSQAGRDWMLRQGIEPECAAIGFEYPMAPVSAARRQGFKLERQLIARTAASLAEEAAAAGILLILEGIGGVRVPVSEKATWVDAVPPVKWGTVVVGRTALGAINHMLLTLDALSYPRVPVAGVVLSRPDEDADPLVEGAAYTEIGHFLKRSTPYLLLDHGAAEFTDLRSHGPIVKGPREAEIIEIRHPKPD